MFTGIIHQCGTVLTIEQTERSAQLAIMTQFTDVQVGESIDINGVCLTVTTALAGVAGDSALRFDISPETLGLTTLHALQQGGKVNVERALRLAD
jgi:riboflavin synthase